MVSVRSNNLNSSERLNVEELYTEARNAFILTGVKKGIMGINIFLYLKTVCYPAYSLSPGLSR